jgi:hypothetical protein
MDDLVNILLGIGIFIGLVIFGIYIIIDKFIINHDIKVKTPLVPTIELIVKNNKIDTLYVYKIN